MGISQAWYNSLGRVSVLESKRSPSFDVTVQELYLCGSFESLPGLVCQFISFTCIGIIGVSQVWCNNLGMPAAYVDIFRNKL